MAYTLSFTGSEVERILQNAKKLFVKREFTGGSDNSLDGVDGDNLQTGYVALVLKDKNCHIYTYVRGATDSENPPFIIAPDVNPTGRWFLCSTLYGFTSDTGFSLLQDAVNAASSEGRALLLSRLWNVYGNCTCDADLIIPKGGGFDVDDEVTLTLNGNIQAGPYQIFFGDGNVTGNAKLTCVHPEWFGVKGDGTSDDSDAIQKAIDFASAIAGDNQHVLVLLPKGRYKITKQIVVKPHVLLHTDGIIINSLSDKFMPAIVFKPYSATTKLRLWGNLGSGVLFGEEGQYCDILIGEVRLWNIGEEYDPEKGPKVGVRFAGYNFKFRSLDIDGGNIGVDINLASDVRGSRVLTYTASLGMRVTSASEHISINSVTIDTPDWRGLQIDSSHDIFLGNVLIFLNDMLNPGSLDYAAFIGEWSSSDKITNLWMNLRVQNTGGVALKISNIVDSVINLNATNSYLATGNNHPVTTAIEYGDGITNTLINVIASDDVTLTSGVPSGMLVRYNEHALEVLTKIKTLSDTININGTYTPSGTNDSFGEKGDIAWDDNYLYVKTSVGWKRVSLSSF